MAEGNRPRCWTWWVCNLGCTLSRLYPVYNVLRSSWLPSDLNDGDDLLVGTFAV